VIASRAANLQCRAGRCGIHGGLSTGPRTPEESNRSGRSTWKHGYYSTKAKRVRRDARQQYRLVREMMAAGNEDEVLDLISSIQGRACGHEGPPAADNLRG
jgi:hypothetical protein